MIECAMFWVLVSYYDSSARTNYFPTQEACVAALIYKKARAHACIGPKGQTIEIKDIAR